MAGGCVEGCFVWVEKEFRINSFNRRGIGRIRVYWLGDEEERRGFLCGLLCGGRWFL